MRRKGDGTEVRAVGRALMARVARLSEFDLDLTDMQLVIEPPQAAAALHPLADDRELGMPCQRRQTREPVACRPMTGAAFTIVNIPEKDVGSLMLEVTRCTGHHRRRERDGDVTAALEDMRGIAQPGGQRDVVTSFAPGVLDVVSRSMTLRTVQGGQAVEAERRRGREDRTQAQHARAGT